MYGGSAYGSRTYGDGFGPEVAVSTTGGRLARESADILIDPAAPALRSVRESADVLIDLPAPGFRLVRESADALVKLVAPTARMAFASVEVLVKKQDGFYGWGTPLVAGRKVTDVLLFGDTMRWTQSPAGGWESVSFDDSSWAIGPQPFVYTDVALGTPHYYYPSPWNAYGVNAVAGDPIPPATQFLSPSLVYARTTINVPESGVYTIAGACDNNLDIYIDGNFVQHHFYNESGRGPNFITTITLTEGTHTLVFRGTGDSFYDGHGVAIYR